MGHESTSMAGPGSARDATFQELNTLRAIAWDGFAQRREFEWRVALGLWTALAAFASLILGKDVRLEGIAPLTCAVVISIVLFGLHLFFIAGIVKGNKADRALANYYTNQMRRLVGAPLPSELQKKVDAHQEQIGLRSYAHIFQLGVTLALCVTAVLAVLWKSLLIDSLTQR